MSKEWSHGFRNKHNAWDLGCSVISWTKESKGERANVVDSALLPTLANGVLEFKWDYSLIKKYNIFASVSLSISSLLLIYLCALFYLANCG